MGFLCDQVKKKKKLIIINRSDQKLDADFVKKLFTLGEIKQGHFSISDVDKKERVNKFKTKHASGMKTEEWSCIEGCDFLTS